MSDLSKFNNIRTLRAQAREMGYEEFKEFVEKVLSVDSELEDEYKKIEEEKAKRAAVFDEIDAMLKSKGIEGGIQELIQSQGVQAQAVSKPGKGAGRGGKGVPRGKAEPKYEFEVGGVKKTWTGRGRQPLELKALLDQGANIEDFLIAKEEEAK